MPGVVSKYMQSTIDRYEKAGGSRTTISKVLVTAAVASLAVKLTYPLVRKHLDRQKAKKCNNNDQRATNNNGHTEQYDKLQDSGGSEAKSEIDKVEQVLATARAKKLQQLPGLNMEFIMQLRKLILIMIPKPFCYETQLLAVHTLCLISRTFLSILVASMEGQMVKYIVKKDGRNFAMMLLKWLGIAGPATFVNSLIRFLENKLALAFRTRLVDHAYQLYFKNQTYYRVSNLDGRIENADHRLTEDISIFTSSVAHLYSHLTKPCLDLMLIGLALARSSQKMKASIVSGPLLAFFVISTTAHIMRVVSPKFGQLVSEEAQRNAYLRHIHSRIITNAEEIAFYGGHKVEHQQLQKAYSRLVSQMNNIFSQKLWFIMLEQFFMKYVWSGTGMVMVSLPILTSARVANPRRQDGDISERTQYLTTARNLLISGADAIERLMSSYKEIVALAGYTHRVAGMLQVFTDASAGIYFKTAVTDGRNNAGILEFKNGQPVAKGKIIYSPDPTDMKIVLTGVPIVTPNCDIVVPSITLTITPGMHLLITGPNGCGKSSLFRILSGLWPIYDGELQIPRPANGKSCMFYIPQRPYMSIGSLRDQIIYPDTRKEMRAKKVTEEMLKEIMRMVSLEHIVLRDSFDEVRDWKDTLSGGEKQRMAVARLFYHKPQYALLDECTSAVSIDVESKIYETAKNMGITLLTITHRPTLWKFHSHLLEFDGQGNWKFEPLAVDGHKTTPPASLDTSEA